MNLELSLDLVSIHNLSIHTSETTQEMPQIPTLSPLVIPLAIFPPLVRCAHPVISLVEQ